MQALLEVMDSQFLGNTFQDYLVAGAVFLGVFVGMPIAKRLVLLCAITFALITVGAPGRARIAFAHEGIWIVEALPSAPPLGWLRGATEALTQALAAFFASVSSVLKW